MYFLRRRLLLTTSVAALVAASGDAYAANSISPELVADFGAATEYFRKAGSDSTYADIFTHSRSGNATMVDSDGVLKWAPHNLFIQSEDITTSWVNTGTTDSANTTTAPDDTSTADTLTATSGTGVAMAYQTVSSLVSSATYSISFFVKKGTHRYVYINTQGATVNNYAAAVFDLDGGGSTATETSTGASSGTVVATSQTSVANGFYLLTLKAYVATSTYYAQVGFAEAATGNTFTSTGQLTWIGTRAGTETFHVWGAHLYRSDLGGMVDNPDQTVTGLESYVPTTSAARYLARRGHHIWNGTSWVNEGVLIETSSRTNLLHETNTMPTQTESVTAQAYTLSFTGTGTVTLSGASTAGPLVGAGTGENNRVSLTFTPSAGTLTLTVSGTVTNAQLEAGSMPSSYIPNVATSGSVTRAADSLTIAAANLPYSATAMSFAVEGRATFSDNNTFEANFVDWYKDTSNEIRLSLDSGLATGGAKLRSTHKASGTYDTVTYGGTAYSTGVNVEYKGASRHGSSFVNVAQDGTAATADLTPTSMPTVSATTLAITLNGTVRTFRMWGSDIGDTGIAEASA